MSKLLTVALCGLMGGLIAWPGVSLADDHHGYAPQRYYQAGFHPPPPGRGGYHHGDDDYDRYEHHHYYRGPYYVPYRAYYPYYGGYGHEHHDHDDALWAFGGLMLGVIIGNTVGHQSAAPPPAGAPSAYSTRPASGPPPNCEDRIVYDAAGNPRVDRHCY